MIDINLYSTLSPFRSLRQMPRGGPINYREEEKKILDSILGKEVYDNRIRPSGLNGTGRNIFRCSICGNVVSFNRSFFKKKYKAIEAEIAQDSLFT